MDYGFKVGGGKLSSNGLLRKLDDTSIIVTEIAVGSIAESQLRYEMFYDLRVIFWYCFGVEKTLFFE